MVTGRTAFFFLQRDAEEHEMYLTETERTALSFRVKFSQCWCLHLNILEKTTAMPWHLTVNTHICVRMSSDERCLLQTTSSISYQTKDAHGPPESFICLCRVLHLPHLSCTSTSILTLVLIDLWVWIPLALAHLSGKMLLLLKLHTDIHTRDIRY